MYVSKWDGRLKGGSVIIEVLNSESAISYEKEEIEVRYIDIIND